MKNHAVVIAGGGPTGLMLAAELALAKIDVVVVERRADREVLGSRAGGLHPRALEIMDQRGIVDRFLSRGKTYAFAPFGGGTVDIGDLPTRHAYYLGLWQNEIERILADWALELGVPIVRGLEVTSFTEDDAGITVVLSDGAQLRSEYLVGCDGGRSVVRKMAGIDFPGWEATTSYLIAEGTPDEAPDWGMRRGPRGVYAIGKLDEGKRARVVLSELELRRGDDPTLDDVRAALVASYGTDYGFHDATWISRFTDMARQAAAYRKGRVLLAGDAAHVHSPAGGQGLNLGVQDAMNLGWKLAQAISGTSPDSLLDTYHSERHPVGARVLRNTMGLVALERGEPRTDALREMVSELMQTKEGRHKHFAMMTALDLHYDLGEGHPLLGRRMPDLDVVTPEGPRRVFSFLHEARPFLLDFGSTSALELGAWSDSVRKVDAEYTGVWELPVLEIVPPPKAVLVRPDGYVAWVGEGSDEGLREALTTWFGSRM